MVVELRTNVSHTLFNRREETTGNDLSKNLLRFVQASELTITMGVTAHRHLQLQAVRMSPCDGQTKKYGQDGQY